MRAKDGIVTRLNAILTFQLSAINQYFLHAKMTDNWGYARLHGWFREASLDLMKDAEHLVEHILYLEGLPNLQRLGQVAIGESAAEDLQLDRTLEEGAIPTYNEAIAHCLSVQDYTTHGLLEEMLKGAEERLAWLETQLTLIEQLGLPVYLSQQIRE